MTGEPKVKPQDHHQPKGPPRRRSPRPLSKALTAKLVHWLKVLHAEECIELCRVVNGQPRHSTRCRQIQQAIRAAEGK
jgi:hypothetical protein